MAHIPYTKENLIELIKTVNYSLAQTSMVSRKDKDIMLASITNNGLSLKYASAKLRNDKELVITAVRQTGLALQYASPMLRNDIDVVLEAVNQNGLALRYASKQLKDEKSTVLAAIHNNVWALKFGGSNVKKDLIVAASALCYDSGILLHVDQSLFNNAVIKFLLTKETKVSKDDWPLIKKAIMEQPDNFLNPPAALKALTENMEYPYLILAEYALNKNKVIDACTNIDFKY